MEEVKALATLDLEGWFMTTLLILIAIGVVITTVVQITKTIKSPVNWIKRNDADHEMIQKITDGVIKLSENEHKMNARMDKLCSGMVEMLGSEIDRRFSKFIRLNGVPENELTTFIEVCQTYESIGGNGKRHDEFMYVTTHMSVLPTETELVNASKSA